MTSRDNQNGAAGSVKRIYALKLKCTQIAFKLGLHSNLKNDQILLINNRTKQPRKKHMKLLPSAVLVFSSALLGSFFEPNEGSK